MADEPLPAAAVELDLRRELALLQAAQAPVIYCDNAPTSGAGGGVGNITLTCIQHIGHDGKTVSAMTTVAHLRFPLALVPVLRQALDNVELLAKPAASNEKQ